MPFVVNYMIINEGDSAASEIKLKDKYETKKFNITTSVEGILNEDGTIGLELDRLAPKSKKTDGDSKNYYSFTVTLTPRSRSLFLVNATTQTYAYDGNRQQNLARIMYNPFTDAEEDEDSDAEKDYRRGSSSSLGRLKVLSKAEYIKKNDYHVLEWLVFAIGFYFAIQIPYGALQKSAADSKSIFDYRKESSNDATFLNYKSNGKR